jgi:hypothetical protein
LTAVDTSERGMWEELEASRRQREGAMFAHDEMIARYHGFYFDNKAKGRTKEPANPAFEMLATMQANLIAGTPQWTVSPARSDRDDTAQRAMGIQYAMNRGSREMNLKRTARKILVDWFFHGGYACLQAQRMPHVDRGPLDGAPRRPTISRVSPKMMRFDARAMDWDDTAWRGYGQLTSIKALLLDAKTEKGWRVKDIEALQPNTDEVTKLVAKEGQGLERDDFLLWSVWFPDEQIDDDLGPSKGFWGSMHYYAQTASRKKGGRSRAPLVEIRDPQPAYCGRRGPIQRFEQYYVPDRVDPLSVTIAIEHIARSYSMREQVIENAMKYYKRVLINGTGDKTIGARLLSMPHMHMLNAKGFDVSKMKEYTMGGPDAVMMAMREFDEERLQQRSGIGAAQQGRTRVGVTATADALAAGGASARQDDLRDMFYDGWAECGMSYAEMIDSDDQFYMPISPDAQKVISKVGPDPRLFTGIGGGREQGQSFEDYEVKVAPMSMRYKSELELRQESDQDILMWTQIGPASVMSPQLDWPAILQDRANATGNALLPSRFNAAVAEQMAILSLHAGIQGAYTPGQARSQPTSARQTVAKPVLSSVGGKSSGPAQKQLGQGSARTAMPGAKAGAKAGGIANVGKVK